MFVFWSTVLSYDFIKTLFSLIFTVSFFLFSFLVLSHRTSSFDAKLKNMETFIRIPHVSFTFLLLSLLPLFLLT